MSPDEINYMQVELEDLRTRVMEMETRHLNEVERLEMAHDTTVKELERQLRIKDEVMKEILLKIRERRERRWNKYKESIEEFQKNEEELRSRIREKDVQNYMLIDEKTEFEDLKRKYETKEKHLKATIQEKNKELDSVKAELQALKNGMAAQKVKLTNMEKDLSEKDMKISEMEQRNKDMQISSRTDNVVDQNRALFYEIEQKIVEESREQFSRGIIYGADKNDVHEFVRKLIPNDGNTLVVITRYTDAEAIKNLYRGNDEDEYVHIWHSKGNGTTPPADCGICITTAFVIRSAQSNNNLPTINWKRIIIEPVGDDADALSLAVANIKASHRWAIASHQVKKNIAKFNQMLRMIRVNPELGNEYGIINI